MQQQLQGGAFFMKRNANQKRGKTMKINTQEVFNDQN